MQDDSRCRPIDFADGLRHGHEDDLNQQQPDSGVLAGPAQSNQPLTENNLDRHTRDHPPDARNTVAWYLRGLQTGTGTVTSAGVSFPAVQAQSTQHISSRSDRRKVVNTQDDIELYLGAEKAPCPNDVQGSHVIAGGAATLPAQATPPGLSNTKLVEARRLLVASIRSKHDPADQKKKTSLPASVASTHSSARQPLRAQALSKKSSNNAGNQIGEISAKEHVNRNDKNPRHTSRRKLSDPDPSAQRGLKPHSKSASQRVMPVQADSRTSHAGQKEKDDHRKCQCTRVT